MTQIFDPKLAISFYAVVSEGSVTAGARARGVAQPWMSEQIRKLERHLGSRLLLRTSRHLELTNEGRQFLPYARALAEANQSAQAFVNDRRSSRSLTLKIGACQFLQGIPERRRLIESVLARHPQVKMDVKIGNTTDLIDELMQGEFDLVMVHLLGIADRTDLEQTLLAQRTGYLLVPEDDALAKLDQVDPALLIGRKLFIGPGNDDIKSMSRALLPLVDAGMEMVHCPDSERSFIEALAMQHRGLCVYWSVDGLPREPLNGQRCVAFGGPPLLSPLGIVRRSGEAMTRPMRWTWELASASDMAKGEAALAPAQPDGQAIVRAPFSAPCR
jgi:DNA-binding transcriptional LysR family regulator